MRKSWYLFVLGSIAAVIKGMQTDKTAPTKSPVLISCSTLTCILALNVTVCIAAGEQITGIFDGSGSRLLSNKGHKAGVT